MRHSEPNDSVLTKEGLAERKMGWEIGDVHLCPGSSSDSATSLHLSGYVTVSVKEVLDDPCIPARWKLF